MFPYSYRIVNKENALEEGIIKAFTLAQARKKLAQSGSTVVLVMPHRDTKRKELSLTLRAFTSSERIFFFRNLGLMTAAGISPATSLRIIQEDLKNKKVRGAIIDIAHEIENGQKISDGMAKYPKYFSEFLIESVRVGEVVGEIAITFDRIANHLEKNFELRRKVIGAVAYPAVVVVVMIGVLILMTAYVLPQIATAFAEFKAELPLPTKLLLAGSAFTYAHPLMFVAAGAAAIAMFVLTYTAPGGKKSIHRLTLKAPAFGVLMREYNLAQFFRTVESLFSRGISLVNAIEIARKTLNNETYRDALETIRPVLIHGGKLTDALAPFPFLFPKQAQKIVEVGEQTGKMEETFGRIASHYERSVSHRTEMMSTLIEPVLIVVVGAIVGALAITIFLPLYNGSMLGS